MQTAADLEAFRSLQRLAYDCVESVGAELSPGMTERDAARAMRSYLRARGVREFFHQPFAWFGDRTTLEGMRAPRSWLPNGRRLEDGMPAILDVAPIRGGYVADVGYACAAGACSVQERLVADLARLRPLIRGAVRAGETLGAIYEEVDQVIVDLGYRNRHQRYPGRVLGHRVERLRGPALPLTLGGFGVRALGSLGGAALAARRTRKRPVPLWNDGPGSEQRPCDYPGLWAVEPHVSVRGVGAKWEELLVVTGEDAYWLDDDLPHVRVEGRAP